MKRFLRSRLVLTLTALLMLTSSIVVALSGSILHSHAAAQMATTSGITITEFPLPTTNAHSNGIIAGPDGNLWFAESGKGGYGGGKIGRITPSGTITEFPTPTAGSGPYGITAGPYGKLWFTEYYGNQIGRITPSGTVP